MTDNSDCECDCHLFVGGSGKLCPECNNKIPPELKTLKDIKFKGLWDNEFPRMHHWKIEQQLKKEAVKWVKHGDYTIDWFKENRGIDITDEKQNWRLWIINFFNLTEEDLK